MTANIVYAYEWDKPGSQFYVSISPGRDGVAVYESNFGVSLINFWRQVADWANIQNKSLKWATNQISTIGDLESIQCMAYSPIDHSKFY